MLPVDTSTIPTMVQKPATLLGNKLFQVNSFPFFILFLFSFIKKKILCLLLFLRCHSNQTPFFLCSVTNSFLPILLSASLLSLSEKMFCSPTPTAAFFSRHCFYCSCYYCCYFLSSCLQLALSVQLGALCHQTLFFGV